MRLFRRKSDDAKTLRTYRWIIGEDRHKIAKLRRQVADSQHRLAKAIERAEQAEAERDRLKAAIEKTIREDDQCGGACEYGQPCPYMPDVEAALDRPEQNGTTRNETE